MARSGRWLRWAMAGGLAVIAAIATAFIVWGGNSSSTITSPVESPTTIAASQSDPELVAAAFLDAWEQRDWTAIEEIAARGVDRVESAYESWWNDLTVSSLELDLGEVIVDAARATALYRVRVGVGTSGVWDYEGSVELLLNAEGWALDWDESAIHPSLEPGQFLGLAWNWGERGEIVDANGVSLVSEKPSVVIGVVPNRIDSRAELADALQEHLEVEPAALVQILDAPGVEADWFLPVETVDRLSYVALRPLLYPVPGVVFRVEDRRGADDAALAADVLGRTGPITAELLDVLGPPYDATSVVGRSGLERGLERRLAGDPGVAVVVRGSTDQGGKVIHEFAGVSGQTVRAALTIEAQRAAEAVLAEVDLPAALVAMSIDTGRIRAVASTPAGGFNEALSGLYPPGSTFKIIVATALLESGMKPADVVSCPEVVVVDGREFKNAASLPLTLSLEGAFAASCNTAFIELGLGLGPNVIAAVAERYGFGDPMDLGLEAAGGSFSTGEDAVAFASSLIGQGTVLASPLQMASVAATAASGRRNPPSLLDDGAVGATAELDERVVADLALMMRAVVTSGTGRRAGQSDREISGKTGTAQVGAGEEAKSIAWFVGFADDLAVAVVVDGGTSGGDVAAPLVADFFANLDDPVFQAAGGAPCVPGGADWPTFQGNAFHTGCSLANPIVSPELKWTSEVGIQAWLNSPVVAGDAVVVGSAGTRRAGPDSSDGVYALSLKDGALLWRFRTANDVNGVSIFGDVAVATGDEGAVWAIDLDSGKELWKYETASPVFGYPVLVGDLVVVGDAAGKLSAIDTAGNLAWMAQLDGAIRGGPSSDGTLVYAVSDLGDLRAYDGTGFRIWSARIAPATDAEGRLPVVYGAPTIARDLVVVTYTVDGGPNAPAIVAFDRYVGQIAWEGSDPGQVATEDWANVRTSVAVAGGQLIVAGSLTSGPQGLRASSGEAVWATPVAVACERQWASPVVMGDLIVVPRPDGAVYGFSSVDGALRWTFAVPAVASTVRLTSCRDDAGSVASSAPDLQAAAAVAPDGTIIVAGTGQYIYAIRDAAG